MTMTPEQEILVNRIRTAITGEASQREVPMFGGIAFMVNDKMIVSAGKDGRLLVRIPAADHDGLLDEPGAEQAEMGTGRSMGPGWITVAAKHIADDTALETWISAAIARQHQNS